MDKQEFYSLLSSNFEWRCNSTGTIRAEKDGRCFCPITAAAYIKTGEFIGINFPLTAARKIGLDIDFACEIVKAADNHAQVSDKDPFIRAALEEACLS
jgi:hypothetical protein